MTRRIPSHRSRRRLVPPALLVTLAVLAVSGAAPAVAGDAVSEARDAVARAEDQLGAAYNGLTFAEVEVAEAQQRANDAAQRLADAQARQDALSAQIVTLEGQLDATGQEISELEPIVAARAVAAYQGGSANPLDLFDADDVIDAARRATLLGTAKEFEDDLIAALGVLEDEWNSQQGALQADRSELASVLDTLAEEQDRIVSELASATDLMGAARGAVADRQALLSSATAELNAAEEEAARRAAEEEAARRAADAATTTTTAPDTTPTTDGDASGEDEDAGDEESSESSGSTDIVCPIDAYVSFVDTWHAPRPGSRLHEGVDIFSTPNAPNVAVVGGVVTQAFGPVQGNALYLRGDDGNTYFYAHLAGYEGGPGRVEQGDVIGYTGDTGNAAGGSYHTHFEYHPGHGSPVNPYALAAAACF